MKTPSWSSRASDYVNAPARPKCPPHPPAPKHKPRMSVLQSLNTINAFTSLISFRCCTKFNHHLTEFQLTEGKGVEKRAGHYSHLVTGVILSHGKWNVSSTLPASSHAVLMLFILLSLAPFKHSNLILLIPYKSGAVSEVAEVEFLGKPLRNISIGYINTFWLAYIAKFPPQYQGDDSRRSPLRVLPGLDPWNVEFPAQSLHTFIPQI